MDERLSATDIARVKVTQHVAFANPGDLVRQKRVASVVVVDACQTQQDDRNVTVLFTDQSLSFDFGHRIGPARVNRRGFGDGLTRFCRRMDEHGAAEDELLDFELPEVTQQAFRAPDSYFFVLRIGLPGQVIVGSQMNHGRDPVPVRDTHSLKRGVHSFVRREVDTDAFRIGGRLMGGHAVKTDYRELARESVDQCRSNETAGSSDNDDGQVIHSSLHDDGCGQVKIAPQGRHLEVGWTTSSGEPSVHAPQCATDRLASCQRDVETATWRSPRCGSE